MHKNLTFNVIENGKEEFWKFIAHHSFRSYTNNIRCTRMNACITHAYIQIKKAKQKKKLNYWAMATYSTENNFSWNMEKKIQYREYLKEMSGQWGAST